MKKIAKLIAINVIICLALWSLVNISLILFFKIDFKLQALGKTSIDPRPTLPNYRGIKWAGKHFEEFNSLPTEYRSYIGWRRLEYDGSTVHVDKNGIRITPQSHHVSDSSTIIAFLGGSTTWGTGSNDSTTIPAFVSLMSNGKYRTINLGESGYNAFQSYIFLLLQIDNGLKPGIIITYDGVNNEFIEGKRTQSHSRESQIIEVMKNQDKSEHVILSFGNVFLKPIKTFINRYFKKRNLTASNFTSNDSIENYRYKTNAIELLNNWLAMKALADRVNSKFLAILQPNAYTGNPKIDHLNLDMENSSKFKYYNQIDKLLKETKYAPLANCILDYSSIFNRDEYIYIDDCHVSPNGNKIVAENILEDLETFDN